MVLMKLKDFYPNYRQKVFGGDEIQGLNVYAGRTELKIGRVCDDLINETGRFRYLAIAIRAWGISKKILLPVNRCAIDYRTQRVYATTLINKIQVTALPEYYDNMKVDAEYEQQVRAIAHNAAGTSASVEVFEEPAPLAFPIAFPNFKPDRQFSAPVEKDRISIDLSIPPR